MNYNKKCIRCNKIKNINDFRKARNQCKECEKELIKIWRNNNKEHIKEYGHNYFQKNKEKLVKDRKQYLHDYRQTTKYKKHKKEYANKNKEKINLYFKERYKNDYIFKLKHNVRVEILRSFKKNEKQKRKKTNEIVGCDDLFLIKHLMKTFKTKYGYEWDGVEKVHIDHIIPLFTAKSENDIIKLCHYSNLQLLKEIDNLKKGINY